MTGSMRVPDPDPVHETSHSETVLNIDTSLLQISSAVVSSRFIRIIDAGTEPPQLPLSNSYSEFYNSALPPMPHLPP